MSDEEVVKLRRYVKPSPWASDIVDRILSDRDSLRTERNEAVEYNTGLRDRVAQLEEALERIADGSTGLPYSRIARQALTSEKEGE